MGGWGLYRRQDQFFWQQCWLYSALKRSGNYGGKGLSSGGLNPALFNLSENRDDPSFYSLFDLDSNSTPK